MVNKHHKSTVLLITAGIIVLVLLTILAVYSITTNRFNLDQSDFCGTYQPESDVPEEYFSIIEDDSESPANTYVRYNADNSNITYGKWRSTNDNYIVLYNEDDDVIATIAYIKETYYIIFSNTAPIMLEKVSDIPVVPEEDQESNT